jgi:hypothetical protein
VLRRSGPLPSGAAPLPLFPPSPPLLPPPLRDMYFTPFHVSGGVRVHTSHNVRRRAMSVKMSGLFNMASGTSAKLDASFWPAFAMAKKGLTWDLSVGRIW